MTLLKTITFLKETVLPLRSKFAVLDPIETILEFVSRPGAAATGGHP
jgi:hypothetical protein